MERKLQMGPLLTAAATGPLPAKTTPENRRNEEEGKCPHAGPGEAEMQNLWLRS